MKKNHNKQSQKTSENLGKKPYYTMWRVGSIISLQHTLASENQILFVIWFALPALCHSDGNADGFQACLVEERTRFS